MAGRHVAGVKGLLRKGTDSTHHRHPSADIALSKHEQVVNARPAVSHLPFLSIPMLGELEHSRTATKHA